MDTTYHYRLSRLVRTQSSEIFLIWEEDRRIGQLDLHFAIESRTIHATLVLEADLPVTVEEELLAQIDDDIVSSYLPSFEREDFLVTVFRGEEISNYTDSSARLTTWTMSSLKRTMRTTMTKTAPGADDNSKKGPGICRGFFACCPGQLRNGMCLPIT